MLTQIKGVVEPILIEGLDDLYMSAFFSWDKVPVLDDKVPDHLVGAHFVKCLVDNEFLLERDGEKWKPIEEKDINSVPPLIIGRIMEGVVGTLSRFGARRPPSVPKPRSRKTRS